MIFDSIRKKQSPTGYRPSKKSYLLKQKKKKLKISKLHNCMRCEKSPRKPSFKQKITTF